MNIGTVLFACLLIIFILFIFYFFIKTFNCDDTINFEAVNSVIKYELDKYNYPNRLVRMRIIHENILKEIKIKDKDKDKDKNNPGNYYENIQEHNNDSQNVHDSQIISSLTRKYKKLVE